MNNYIKTNGSEEDKLMGLLGRCLLEIIPDDNEIESLRAISTAKIRDRAQLLNVNINDGNGEIYFRIETHYQCIPDTYYYLLETRTIKIKELYGHKRYLTVDEIADLLKIKKNKISS